MSENLKDLLELVGAWLLFIGVVVAATAVIFAVIGSFSDGYYLISCPDMDSFTVYKNVWGTYFTEGGNKVYLNDFCVAFQVSGP